MREVEFVHATDDEGLMSFRVNLPLERAKEFGKAAADGQMGCIMKLYRDWQLSGDDEMLKTLWPHVKKAVEFCWIPGGWDADQDGVMEGCQHNTMDVEYYGPNPQMGIWYLGALRAAEEMARYVGDQEFAATCRDLFERGSAWTDANLFNGEYYEHQIRPPTDESQIAAGLLVGMGAKDPTKPDYQLGAGCLVDQLVGQYMAHVCGLGYLLDPEHVRTTLRSILKYNYRESLYDHFNCMRSFALGDESALLMASLPEGPAEEPVPLLHGGHDGLRVRRRGRDAVRGPEERGARMHRGHPRPLRRPEAQPLRRGRVRPPLRPRDGQLGRGPRPHRASTTPPWTSRWPLPRRKASISGPPATPGARARSIARAEGWTWACRSLRAICRSRSST